MSIVYDFGNNQNWVSIFNDTFTAAAVPTQELREYYPIPDIVIPIQISSPVIAIYCASSSDPGTWNYAGKVRQKINSGLLVGGVLDGLIATRRLKLREVNILRFDRVSSSYSIEISIPYWLRDIGLLVWEYIGLIEDTVETQLDEILNKLESLIGTGGGDSAVTTAKKGLGAARLTNLI